MKMSAKRAFYAMLGSIFLLFVILIATVVMGDLWLQGQSQKLMSIRLENRLIDEQQAAVVKANKDIEKYATLEKVANSIVPQDKDQAKSVREIVNLAKDNHVAISSITFPASTLGAAAPPKSSATTSSTTPTVTAPPITQAVPVSGATGVYQMQVTVQGDTSKPINYTALINFLQALENNRRTAQEDNISIQPNIKDTSLLTFTLGINVFIKP